MPGVNIVSLIAIAMLACHFLAHVAFKEGKALLPVREPITTLKLVGR